MGYRARRNGRNGFVTAGHGVRLNDNVRVTSVNGTTVGTVTRKTFDGSVDAAFVETSSGITPTNSLVATNFFDSTVRVNATLSTTTSLPGAGTVINKIGRATNHTSGKILSTRATTTYTDTTTGTRKTFTNLTSADYHSASGDSGGIVYSFIASTNTRLTLGIHVASNGSTRFYSKADEINRVLGLTRY